mmetsp:Transcript_17176/g.25245  ORF Transcript_17176/g.25245 Transcript_17176/m.25245 type:complete len:82 (-) Transcript_17176:367-612(-)
MQVVINDKQCLLYLSYLKRVCACVCLALFANIESRTGCGHIKNDEYIMYSTGGSTMIGYVHASLELMRVFNGSAKLTCELR